MELLITKELLQSSTEVKNGYSQKQIEMAKVFCHGKSPMTKLVGKTVSKAWWEIFIAAKPATTKKKKSAAKKHLKENLLKLARITRAPNSWEWKPLESDVPRIKVVSSINGKNQGVKKSKRQRVVRTPDNEFYTSPEWRSLRVRVLSKYDCKCMMCGRSPKVHGIVIHVDHIKPRSKYPDLALCFDNLQILCEDCNLGKSNRYEDDYRPDGEIGIIPYVVDCQS